MESFKSTIIIALLVFGLLTPIAQANSPSLLLQQGLYAEETEGDLEKAIDLYEQVLEEYKEVERLAARANLTNSECVTLKKRQKQKAAEYFLEAIDYYPEQIKVVEKAQAQLSKIKPASNQDVQAQIISYLCQQHTRAYNDAKKNRYKVQQHCLLC